MLGSDRARDSIAGSLGLPTLLNLSDVHGFLATAGEQIGICDWRPRFGRFSVADPSAPARRRRR